MGSQSYENRAKQLAAAKSAVDARAAILSARGLSTSAIAKDTVLRQLQATRRKANARLASRVALATRNEEAAARKLAKANAGKKVAKKSIPAEKKKPKQSTKKAKRSASAE